MEPKPTTYSEGVVGLMSETDTNPMPKTQMDKLIIIRSYLVQMESNNLTEHLRVPYNDAIRSLNTIISHLRRVENTMEAEEERG